MATATPQHSVSVAAVVTDDQGRVLVIRRADNGHWEIPGGVLELAEGLEAGVHREVAEETGTQVTIDSLSGVYKNLTRGIVALVFRCRPQSGTPRPSTEAVQVAWMTPAQVRDHMDPAFAVRVDDALRPGTHYRDHDGIHLAVRLPDLAR